jgi:SAM-dependent methyltransferase
LTVEQNESSLAVIWHDLECGAYGADLALWRTLAEATGDPVLDVGAGTGRTALALAADGHCVTALDEDPVLLAELTRRAGRLPVTAVLADAREMDLEERFALIIVPMQTIQLLGGQPGRRRFLSGAARHLHSTGVVAIAITEKLDCFSLEEPVPLPTPDMTEIDGVVYSSQPTAVREEPEGFVLERLRERITPDGRRLSEHDAIRLDRLAAAQLEQEARAVGLQPLERQIIEPTADHVGSVVVKLGV